ncbi:DUF805 domain-containing protein [Rathayibacter sp. KR2-224]|uniref:DUF805 domain-containing protein n=1 Tax=Rathayibacter sp. KR2-224 TaxID=3400913 RepID=UPI003C0101FB
MPDLSPAPQPSVPRLETQPSGVPPLDQPYYGAPFGTAFTRFWQKYATFTGRASRAEFWWWALTYFGINILASVVIAVIGAIAGGGAPPVLVVGFQMAWTAATIVPFVALSWRRLHDSNHHGWWALPFLVLAGVQAALNALGIQPMLSSAPFGSTTAAVAVSVATGIFGLVFGVVILVLALRPPNPAGCRFDK